MSDFDDTFAGPAESLKLGPRGNKISLETRLNSKTVPQDLLYLDTETCGFHGLIVLIQYASGNGEIKLYDVWFHTFQETIELIEWITTQRVVGFNLAFDWFHICKLYTTWLEYIGRGGDPDALPVDSDYSHLAACEEAARRVNVCVKPRDALDLMLYARKGPYQSLMARDDIRIKRVPRIMAQRLREELENRIQLDGIYFNKRSDKEAPNWNIYDCKTVDGDPDPDFQDVVLKFHPDGALKSLAKHLLKAEDILTMGDVEVDKKYRPEEVGYAPFAMAIGRPGRWKWSWPDVIKFHIDHWRYNQRARKYATDDIIYTRGLHQHDMFADAEIGDDDSVLACMVGAVRWRGFAVDLERVKKQRDDAVKRSTTAPTDHGACKRWLAEVMDAVEFTIIKQRGTGKVILEEIGGKLDEETGVYLNQWTNEDGTDHKASIRARAIFDSRRAQKEVELYDKLLLAGRFHASFVVIGTLSTRMAGSDGLNPQGIISSKFVRECFILSDGDDYQLDGGDFDSFEVCISAAVYKDEGLENDIKSGKKIHALLAQAIYPEQDYDSVMASKGSKSGKDYYTDGKRAVFGLNYGGDANTLVKRLGISKANAENAFQRFEARYPGVKRARQRIIDMFCSMRQPGGIGSRVEWHEPAEKIESLLGFPRYFNLENQICKALYDLGNHPPKPWTEVRIKVVRRDREQTAAGACRSALFGAAFALQGAAMRAAANHIIQSTGAGTTKRVERRIWDHQPVGVHCFVVVPMNVHDEIMTVTEKSRSDEVKLTVDKTVAEFKPIIPLIRMDYCQGLKSWASK